MDYIVERQNLIDKITSLTFDNKWRRLAIQLFNFQYKYNSIYQRYVDLVGIKPENVRLVHEIPCLPIEFFKTYTVQTGSWKPERLFLSSGTSGQVRSKHALKDQQLYKFVTERCFESFFGSLSQYALIAILPSYLDNPDSSLLFMVDHFIANTRTKISDYYPVDKVIIESAVIQSKKEHKIPLIFGVSYALLDLAEHDLDLSLAVIIETGGMKGRRKELLKSELHSVLQKGFQLSNISSEYGMAELMSQAYALKEGIFENSNYLKIRCKEINDPFVNERRGKTGIIECIDLANIDSCCFIQTQDLGRMIDEHHFEIIGRLQDSDLRGCNLMYDQISI